VQITAFDIDMAGSLTAGTMAISIHGSKASQTFGIGLTQNMEILDTELGRFACEAGLTIGTATSGSIQVNGVTDGNSDSVGTLSLVATKSSATILFKTGASVFDKGIIMQANGGIVMSWM